MTDAAAACVGYVKLDADRRWGRSGDAPNVRPVHPGRDCTRRLDTRHAGGIVRADFGVLFPFSITNQNPGNLENPTTVPREGKRTLIIVVLAKRGGFVFCTVDQLGYLRQC